MNSNWRARTFPSIVAETHVGLVQIYCRPHIWSYLQSRLRPLVERWPVWPLPPLAQGWSIPPCFCG